MQNNNRRFFHRGQPTEQRMREVPKITHAYILGDGSIHSADQVIKTVGFLKQKAIVDGSTQEGARVNQVGNNPDRVKLVQPPYDPLILAKFYEADEINFRACNVKVSDAIGRGYDLVRREGSKVSEDTLEAQRKELRLFFRTCNKYDRFWGVWKQVATDYEAVGWGALEVVRSFDKRIARLVHIPAAKIMVMESWKGFAENRTDGTRVYYQPFGMKVVSKNRKTATGEREPFDIEQDGSWDMAEWNLQNRADYFPQDRLEDSANEIIYIPKNHPKTIYYGLPDIIPAIGYALANLNIRDFLLQFFDYNTIPQYAVIIKGADLSEEVKSAISTYFSRDIKGQQHRTLIIPIPSTVGAEIEVKFERLEQGSGEGHIEDRRMNQTSIMVAHGVSPIVLGIADVASLGSGTGAAQLENYRERVVEPAQQMWAEQINEMLLNGLGITDIVVEFDPYSVEDRGSMLRDMLLALNAGAITINQLRDIMNFGKPIPGGDRPFVMSAAGPIFIEDLAKVKDGETVVSGLMKQLEGMVAKKQEQDTQPTNVQASETKTTSEVELQPAIRAVSTAVVR